MDPTSDIVMHTPTTSYRPLIPLPASFWPKIILIIIVIVIIIEIDNDFIAHGFLKAVSNSAGPAKSANWSRITSSRYSRSLASAISADGIV